MTFCKPVLLKESLKLKVNLKLKAWSPKVSALLLTQKKVLLMKRAFLKKHNTRLGTLFYFIAKKDIDHQN